MQLSELIADIKDELNKGNAISDSKISSQIRATLLYLENLENWSYMDRFVEFTIDPDAESPRALTFPSDVKAIEFLRLYGGDITEGNYQYLEETKPKLIQYTPVDGLPSYYFKDGVEFLWMDKIPTEAYSGEMSYLKYTTWSGSDSFEPWLLQYQWPLVKYFTLTALSPYVRDERLLQGYSALYQTHLKAAIDANTELEYKNNLNQMQYKG